MASMASETAMIRAPKGIVSPAIRRDTRVRPSAHDGAGRCPQSRQVPQSETVYRRKPCPQALVLKAWPRFCRRHSRYREPALRTLPSDTRAPTWLTGRDLHSSLKASICPENLADYVCSIKISILWYSDSYSAFPFHKAPAILFAICKASRLRNHVCKGK
jgi:hypothetical protein